MSGVRKRSPNLGGGAAAAAVLGGAHARAARNVRREDANDHIFGYTVIDDVGARWIAYPVNSSARAELGLRYLPH